jgi:hypothetical protein
MAKTVEIVQGLTSNKNIFPHAILLLVARNSPLWETRSSGETSHQVMTRRFESFDNFCGIKRRLERFLSLLKDESFEGRVPIYILKLYARQKKY